MKIDRMIPTVRGNLAAHLRRTQLFAEIAELEIQPLTALLYPLPAPTTRSVSRNRITFTPTRHMK